MAKIGLKGIPGKEKVAILLVALGNEIAAEIYKRLDDATIEIITLEIANLRKVSPEARLEVLKDAQEMLLAREYMARGGVDYARDILERALGTERAQSLLTRITASLQVRPFDFMRHTDAQQILGFIQGEHPQTIALIMAYLEPEQAASIISGLSAQLQAEVAKRIAAWTGLPRRFSGRWRECSNGSSAPSWDRISPSPEASTPLLGSSTTPIGPPSGISWRTSRRTIPILPMR
ncbi:hypothetical protein MASR2M17_13980 [Aminivibrio sp.]